MARLIMTVLVFIALTDTIFATVPSSITVQGRLTDALNAPITTAVTFRFRIFDAPSGGSQIWPGAFETQILTPNAEGLWTAEVGHFASLTEIVFADSVRWLEIEANSTVLPRVRLVTGPYAYRVATVNGASGGNITSQVSIGPGHVNTGLEGFVAGINNTVSGSYGAVGGGTDNSATNYGAIVSGGEGNDATASGSSVGGGQLNTASGFIARVAGGQSNTASATGASVGGGYRNLASSQAATVAGGADDTASGGYASVGGGDRNSARDDYSTIAGGLRNSAIGTAAAVGGGSDNIADYYCAVGGGEENNASGNYSTIGGGYRNHAYGTGSVISGGGGGQPADTNFASGLCASIPGGARNVASGSFAFAAGRGSQALHRSAFVWADSAATTFASTGDGQFLIRAAGGVGIGTNGPLAPLHVLETDVLNVTINPNSIAVLERTAGGWLSMVADDNSQLGILFSEPSLDIAGGIVFDDAQAGANGLGFRTGGNNTRMTLDAAGNLNVDGAITGASCCAPSDARFKRDIETLPKALDMVAQLRGVRYKWEREKFADREFPPGEQVGLIAQEVRDVVPQAVIEQSDGYLAVDYARLVPLLIESIKEQQKQIDELKSRLDRKTP